MAALSGRSLSRVGRQQWTIAGAVLGQQQQCREANVVRSQTSNLAAHRRGRGGRSSFSGNVVTVFGASGFFGRYVVNRLGKIGSQVILPHRGDAYWMKELKLCGDLGQIINMPFHLRDDETLFRVMKHSNIVINLIGREWETRNFTYKDVNTDAAGKIARIAKKVGVEKLVHISHLNASYNPKPFLLPGGSEYLKTKMEGEDAVRQAFPEAIVFRPADVYGVEDWFLNYYLNPWRGSDKKMALYEKGLKTIKMPLYVADIAEGIVNSIQEPDAVGKTYEAVGPERYTQRELIDFIFRILRKPNHVTNLNKWNPLLVRWQLATTVYKHGHYTLDKLDREAISDKVTGLPTLEDLGVKLSSVETRMPFLLKGKFKDAYLDPKLGEWPDPAPPQRVVTPQM